MIIILSFSFLCHKSQLCSYVIHIMTHLHLANDLKFEHLEIIFWIHKNFNYHNFLDYGCFSYVDGRLSSFQNFPIKFFLSKESLA
jgi:hypothetical protein